VSRHPDGTNSVGSTMMLTSYYASHRLSSGNLQAGMFRFILPFYLCMHTTAVVHSSFRFRMLSQLMPECPPD
jgi:hypothetical protein